MTDQTHVAIDELVLAKLDKILGRLDQLDRVERLVSGKIKPTEWVTKEEAMHMLNCGSNKLRRLYMSGKIIVNQNPGKNIRLHFSTESINNYLANPHL